MINLKNNHTKILFTQPHLCKSTITVSYHQYLSMNSQISSMKPKSELIDHLFTFFN